MLPKKKVIKKGKSLELKSRVTVRALCRILNSLQKKLLKMMSKSEHYDDGVTPEDIRRAMSHPATHDIVQEHVKRENIKLVHRDSLKPVYQKQMSEIGERGAAAANAPQDYDEILDDCKPEEATLVATEEAKRDIANTVNELVRTNSLTKPPSKKGSMELDGSDGEQV